MSVLDQSHKTICGPPVRLVVAGEFNDTYMSVVSLKCPDDMSQGPYSVVAKGFLILYQDYVGDLHILLSSIPL